jgi:hypothetical protein
VKYVILIHHNKLSQDVWEQLPHDARRAGLGEYTRLNEDLAASGEAIVHEALAQPQTAKRVTVQDGSVLTTDGPFAEAKEHLAGFYFVDVASQARAVEIAARIPEARFGLVEVRPVMDLSAFEP